MLCLLYMRLKSGLARCRGCKKSWAVNSSRLTEHIENCPPALQILQRSKQMTLLNMSKGVKNESLDTALDRALARAVFAGNRPFSMWSEPFMRDVLQLCKKGYTPPDRHRIGGALLTEFYTESYSKTMDSLSRIQHLNITVDETSNINHERVMVLTITTAQKSWFYCLKNMHNTRLNANNISKWILEQIEAILSTISDGELDWECINSLSTDTCSVMRSVWRILQRKPQINHAFMIPCDSHGLQLIFKDLLDMKASQTTTVKHIFKEASDIVSFFRQSPLKYGDLQAIEIIKNGKKKALIASVITRWGTQYDLICSVNELKDSLIQWAASITEEEDKAKMVEVIGIIQDITFWNILNDLCKVFKPLHIAQKNSEASNATIMEVIPRWLRLENDITTAALYTQLHEDIKSYFKEGGFAARSNLQLLPIHWVAYWLNPTTILQPIESSRKEQIRAILEPQKAWSDFLHFRQQDGPFYKAPCWQEKNDYTAFWLEAVSGNNITFYNY